MFELKQVTTPAAIAEFHAVAALDYQNDPQYIKPLTADIEEIFDRGKNEAYNGGDAIRWVLTENGKLLGRVAA